MDQNVKAIYAANKYLEQCYAEVYKLTFDYHTILPSNDHVERQKNANDLKKGIGAIRDNLHAVEMVLRELDYMVAEQNAASNLTRWFVRCGTDRLNTSQQNFYTVLTMAKEKFIYFVNMQKRYLDPKTRPRHSQALVVELIQMNPDGSWEVIDKFDPAQEQK